MLVKQPNVILVITDDQGYGDLGCTGNPWIQTPNLDHFYEDSVRLRDFHVSPLCAPTRGALMTGRRPLRNGVWATCWGRSILRKEEVTAADVFATNGYSTGLFGKWHLGDNYPYRPQDRGFQRVVAHKGGGVGQTPDFWGNNYFDDTYFHNEQPVKHEGYCTDIWFEEAFKFMEENKDYPFFAYISTNAPHSPYLVADQYALPYRGNRDIPSPEFYGMISNIDENFGRLREKLVQLGIENHTILIFMTDNGSSAGADLDKNQQVVTGYNAGMRGKKGSYYDGGHRVPFFIRWPEGGLKGGKDIEEMAFHVDLLPTFIDVCNLRVPKKVDFDGRSLRQILREEFQSFEEDRVEFIQFRQDTIPPEKWTNAVATRKWRLIKGQELYDIKSDPGQKNDVASMYPEVVERLRVAHEQWWEEVLPEIGKYSHISLGSDEENPARLDALDVMGDVAWSQHMVVNAQKSTGKWAVHVEKPGTYRFALRRWPEELNLPINQAIDEKMAQSVAPYGRQEVECAIICPVKAKFKIFDMEWETIVHDGDLEAVFNVTLDKAGETSLEASFIDDKEEQRGAYYVYVERL